MGNKVMKAKFIILEDGIVLERKTAYISSIEIINIPTKHQKVKIGIFGSSYEPVEYRISYCFTAGDARQKCEWSKENKEEILKIWKEFIYKLNWF